MARLALLLLPVVLLACGGGGGDDGGGLSERELRTEAERLCAEFNRDVLHREVPGVDPNADAFFADLAERERRLFADLRELEPPDELKETYERAVRAGRQDKASRFFVELGIDGCATYGLYVLPNGPEISDRAAGACDNARLALPEVDRRRQGRPLTGGFAEAFRVLADELDALAPPAEAEEMWKTALGELRATARAVDGYVSARDGAQRQRHFRALNESYARGGTAWFLLNVEECTDLYAEPPAVNR